MSVHRERGSLVLIVVLESGGEEPHHLHRQAGRAGDAHAAVLVGGEDLLDVALGDDVAHRRPAVTGHHHATGERSEEHTSELQSLMRISYAVFCLKKKKKKVPHRST